MDQQWKQNDMNWSKTFFYASFHLNVIYIPRLSTYELILKFTNLSPLKERQMFYYAMILCKLHLGNINCPLPFQP